MEAIVYPTTLPGPMPGSFAPRPRRATSPLDGPLQQRARQRDAAGMASQYTYVYTPDASSGGNLRFWGYITAEGTPVTRAWAAGDQVRIAAGDLQFVIAG